MNNHVNLGYKKYKDDPLIAFAQGVHDALIKNAGQFPNLPVSLADLQDAITDFTTKRIAAVQGSVAQTEARKAARTVLLGKLNPIALHVEGVALGNADVIRAAGFDTKVHGYTAQSNLAKPSLYKAVNVASTKIQLRVKAQRNVRSVKVQYRSAGGDWQDGGDFLNTKVVVVVNLTPGTMYDFRVQFIGGRTGTSDWSEVLSHMAI
jgi:hypothetical protein